MIASLSAAIAAGPIGRTYVSLRDGPLGKFAALPIFDWVIPVSLVGALIVGTGFVFFGAN